MIAKPEKWQVRLAKGRGIRTFLWFVGFPGALIGCQGPAHPSPIETSPYQVVDGDSYDEELEALTIHIDALTVRAERFPDSYLPQEALAAAHKSRAHLTGDIDDFLASQTALEQTFQIQPLADAYLSRARLRFSLHQLELAEADLIIERERLLINNSRRAEIEGLQGEIELHSGRFTEALDSFEEALEAHRTMPGLFRLALYHWHTGDFALAEQTIEEAESLLDGSHHQARSFLSLSRGLLDLDRGRIEDALAHYENADAAFPGHWLIHEHIAEALVLLGRGDQAELLYRQVVEETQSPELMGALAELLGAQGRHADAEQLNQQATAIFQQQLEDLPEAAVGHALAHFVTIGDHERALQLAIQSHALRPGGAEAIELAAAHLALNQVPQARAALAPVLEGPYQSARLFVVQDLLLRQEGNTDEAAAALGRARAIDPSSGPL